MKKISSKSLKNILWQVLTALSVILAATPKNSHAMPFFSKNKLPTTPYALQIDISKKGNKAEVDLRIKPDEKRKGLEPKTVGMILQIHFLKQLFHHLTKTQANSMIF